MSFFNELKRRNVFRIAGIYAVVAWILMQVASTLESSLNLPEWFDAVITAGLMIGFPIALLLAWAFELTPDGIKKEEDVDRSVSITTQTGRKLDFTIIALMAVALIYFIWESRFSDDVPNNTAQTNTTDISSPANPSAIADISQIESIAVLAFEDFSADGDQVHLAEGLADAVLHMLAQIDGLRVSARTSSFSFRGKNISVANIGKELGVAAILEGSVQRSGDTLRIIAQLIRVSDQSHLWSKTFDRPTGDIFAIQDEIASAVVTALRPAAESNTSNSAQTNLVAYEHFLRGDALWQRRSKESIEQAIVEFQAAIASDPNYAPAHAGLAMSYRLSTIYGDRTISEVKLIVEQSIERALVIDENLSMAYAARGSLLTGLGQLTEAETAYRYAIKLNPSDANVLIWLSSVLSKDTFHRDEILLLKKQAYALDPRNQFVLGNYAGILANYGDYSGSLTLYHRGIVLDPEAPKPYGDIASLHAQYGHHDKAIIARIAQIERAPESPQPYRSIAYSFLALDDQEAAQAWFDRAKALNPNEEYWPNWFIRKQDSERLILEMQAALMRDVDNPSRQGNLCFAHLMSKQYQEVKAICSNTMAKVLGPEDADISFNKYHATRSLYWAARQTGDNKTAKRLLDKMDRFNSSEITNGIVHWAFFEEMARLSAFKNDRDGVIKHLNRSLETGLLNRRGLMIEPWWDDYQDDVDFIAILDEIEKRQTKQLNALRAEGL